MELTAIPTEQSTAATDLLLCCTALVCLAAIRKNGAPKHARRLLVWKLIFALTALSSALGAAVHGLALDDFARHIIWQPINLGLGMVVSLFVVGVVHDLSGPETATRLLPWMLAAGLAFYLFSAIFPETFLVFIIYEAAVLFFALGAYIRLTVEGRLAGSGLMAGSILTSITGAVIQATYPGTITIIWQFDNNALFHLVQAFGLLLLAAGLRAGSAPASEGRK